MCMHIHFIKETVHTSVCLVEGTWFTSLVLHPVRRSGMRWPGTAVVWICAVGGRHWPATSFWTTSTISPVKRSSWVSTVVSDVWTVLQNISDNIHLTTRHSTLSPRIISIHLQEMNLPYILESNLDPFYSFRWLKNQMQIRIACGLDSRSRAGFWINNRAAVRVVRTIE